MEYTYIEEAGSFPDLSKIDRPGITGELITITFNNPWDSIGTLVYKSHTHTRTLELMRWLEKKKRYYENKIKLPILMKETNYRIRDRITDVSAYLRRLQREFKIN